ncbi:MAG TPA: hypothetical protein VFP72_04405 [Kineosporiaceae bacterium]|nr:hypothetical protein [Kineosporiaceae bacterium]
MEVRDRLERLRRRAELEQRLLACQAQIRPGAAVGTARCDRSPATSMDRDVPEPWGPGHSGAEPVGPPPVRSALGTASLPSPRPGAVRQDGARDATAPTGGPAPDGGHTPDGRARHDPEPLDTASEPERLAPIVYEILATLRPVLRRHPGLTIGVWPAGTPTDEAGTAVRFSLSANDELALHLPDLDPVPPEPAQSS